MLSCKVSQLIDVISLTEYFDGVPSVERDTHEMRVLKRDRVKYCQTSLRKRTNDKSQ